MKAILKKSMAMILVVLMALSCCAISSFAAVEKITFSVEKIVAPENFKPTHRDEFFASDLAVYGNYLYIHSRYSGTQIWDITDPEAPVFAKEMGTAAFGQGATDATECIDIYGDKLFVMFKDNKIGMFSLANPTEPAYVASFSVPAQCNIEVGPDGTLYAAYQNAAGDYKFENASNATGDDNTMTRIDDSANFNYYETANGTVLRFRNGNLMQNANGSGENYPAYKAVASAGDYFYILLDNAIECLDVSSKSFSTGYASKTTVDLSSLNFDETAAGLHGATVGNHIYFFSENGVLCFDVTNPASPVNVQLDTEGIRARNTAVKGDYIYAVDGSSYAIYKVTDEGISMTRQAEELAPSLGEVTFNAAYGAKDLASYGDYIFFHSNWNGLCSYNVKTGAIATGLSPRTDPDGFTNMYVSGTTLFVGISINAASHKGCFQAYDISNPAAPTLIGTITDSITVDEEEGTTSYGVYAGTPYGLGVAGNTAYFYGNYGWGDATLPLEGDTKIDKRATGNLGGWADVIYGSDENLYAITEGSTNLAVQNKGAVVIDNGAYSAFTNAGYLYVIQNDALKVVREADVYSDGTPSAELYAANGTTVPFTGVNETMICPVPVVYDNYLVYAADKLLVFDITNPAAPAQVNVGDIATSASTVRGIAVNDGVLYIANGGTTVTTVDLDYEVQEVVSTEITSLPVTFAGTAAGVDSITLAVGSDSYTVPVVGGKWSKEITSITDGNGIVTVSATAGTSTVSIDYTVNVAAPELAISVEYTDVLNANVTIENNTENKTFMLILVVYDGGTIVDVDYETLSDSGTLSCSVEEGTDTSGFTAKTFVWSSLMVPMGLPQ